MTISLVRQGTAGNSTNTTTLSTTFTSPTPGNVLILLVTSDFDLVSCTANGSGASFNNRLAVTAFCKTFLLDKLCDGTETGITWVDQGNNGVCFRWMEVSGIDSTPNATSSARPGFLQDLPVGTVTPSTSSFVVWGLGVDFTATLDSTSVGTFDGQNTGFKSSGQLMVLGCGHTTSSSTLSPTVHATGAKNDTAGVIGAYAAASPSSLLLPRPRSNQAVIRSIYY